VNDYLTTERLMLRPVTTEDHAAPVAVIKRLGMTAFDVVPGLLGPMTRYRRTAQPA